MLFPQAKVVLVRGTGLVDETGEASVVDGTVGLELPAWFAGEVLFEQPSPRSVVSQLFIEPFVVLLFVVLLL